MKPVTSERTARIHMPPIHPIMNRVREMRKKGHTIFSMAQAVPWYTPPHEALTAFQNDMQSKRLHFYSPDPGFSSTRKIFANELRKRRGINLEAEKELHMTCGASQAFVSALLAVTDPGDRVIVLEPYYFDHVFAVHFSNLVLDSVPMIEDSGWSVPWEILEEKTEGAKVMVLVNPGNPTGATLTEDEIRRIVKLTGENDCTLIIDETYERFIFTGSTYHPWMEHHAEHVLTLGSFSKSFSLSGWRLGYLFGADYILEQALKVQDSVVICPSSPGQILLEHCLALDGWVDERSKEVERRLKLCKDAIDKAQGLDWREVGGGFFVLAGIPDGTDCEAAADFLLENHGIAVIPGKAFGSAGKHHLRLSFGCLCEEELLPAMSALAGVNLNSAKLKTT